MASANEPTDETLAGDAGSTLLVFEDLVCELRAVASSHVDEATALLTLSGIAVALFRFACREIGRVKACFSDAIDGDETTV